jgi:two-component system, response regulator PdtaR
MRLTAVATFQRLLRHCRRKFTRNHSRVVAVPPSNPGNALPNKPVILVVEDDPIIRMGAVQFVADAGFEALEAEHADEAIRILEARSDIHLVFTDVGMPGTMDGLKLARYIRRRWPPVKLIVASGKAIIGEGHLPPGARFFPKPYSEDTMIKAMTAMLSEGDQRPNV